MSQISLLQPKPPSTVRLRLGLCQDVLEGYPANHFGACVTDPPYGLSAPPDIRVVLRAWLDGETYEHGSKGFMAREWDSFVPGPEVWREVFRVMKPGAFLVCFAGQRTVDLMGISLRLAGFELRDLGAWLYWSGFPKSLDLSKSLDKDNGTPGTPGDYVPNGKNDVYGEGMGGGVTTATYEPASPEARQWSGWGTALKPALEPFLLARKPLEGTYIQNLRRWGVGGLNIDACRYAYGDKAWPGPGDRPPAVPQPVFNGERPGVSGGHEAGVGRNGDRFDVPDLGRWPANVYATPKASRSEREAGCERLPAKTGAEACDREEGSAGLTPRAGAGRTAEEVRNSHPTVKPLALMRWLVRLVTPPGEIVLDPFLGSGTTLCACLRERRDGVGIEADPEHLAICAARIDYHRGIRS